MTDRKELLLNLLLLPGASAPFSLLMNGRASIFMLHRFSQPDLGIEGHDPRLLRQVLAYLRKNEYLLLSLEELFRHLRERSMVRRAVVFTIDDGYLDHALVAAPIFAEFDCPVTTFVTTGFLDGRLWFWWDQVRHVFMHTSRHELRLYLAGVELHYRWADAPARHRCQQDFAVRCTNVIEADRRQAINCLVAEADVEVPHLPPPAFAPMSWEQARACERRGMSFGPHTVTHPILSRTPDGQSLEEISRSWERLQYEMRQPVPIFCYPNGRLADFGAREIATLRRLGLVGAVTGVNEYADVGFRSGSEYLYQVPRFGYPDTVARVVQYVSGFERLKRLLRQGGSYKNG